MSKAFNPGNLNKKISVMSLDQVSDGGGGYEDKLILIKKFWSNIRPVSGREYWEAQQAQAKISHKVTIRYTNLVNRTHIISFGDRSYDIQYIVNVDEENRFLTLHVVERQ